MVAFSGEAARSLTEPFHYTLEVDASLRVVNRELEPFKQPELLWYIEAADTPSENRGKVLEPIRQVPGETQKLFNVNPDDERKITWWWQRPVVVAVKH